MRCEDAHEVHDWESQGELLPTVGRGYSSDYYKALNKAHICEMSNLLNEHVKKDTSRALMKVSVLLTGLIIGIIIGLIGGMNL